MLNSLSSYIHVLIIIFIISIPGNAHTADTDGDGIHDDGDWSGIVGDNPCTGVITSNCDDNCLTVPNPFQADMNIDGEGDACDDTDNDSIVDASDECPLTPPAFASGTYYSLLQDAYDAALDGDTIKSHAVVLTEDLNIDINKSVSLRGGFDCGYSDPPFWRTVLNGSMTITDGSLTIESGAFATASGVVARIMPMGDSITRGGGYPIGELDYPTYRYYLNNMLSDAGWQVDYVGPYNGVGINFNATVTNPYVIPAAHQDSGHPNFTDQDMAGSTGWLIDRYLINGLMPANTLTEQYDPDIVLVHLGTNDLGGGSNTPSEAAAEIGQLIDLIRAGSPSVKIVVAQIIPLINGAYRYGSGNEYQLVQDFNALLPGVISQKNQIAGYPIVTLVDMWTGFDPGLRLAEKTHPNDLGDRELAHRWFDAIQTVFGQ